MIHAVNLDPFPNKDPDHLMSVSVRGQRGGNGGYFPIEQFLEISERNTVLSGVMGLRLVQGRFLSEPEVAAGTHKLRDE